MLTMTVPLLANIPTEIVGTTISSTNGNMWLNRKPVEPVALSAWQWWPLVAPTAVGAQATCQAAANQLPSSCQGKLQPGECRRIITNDDTLMIR